MIWSVWAFFLLLPEKYPAEKKVLMLVLYPSGSADLKQVNWGDWENDLKGNYREGKALGTFESHCWWSLYCLVEIPGEWKMVERTWRTMFWWSGVLGSFCSSSFHCLPLKSIPGHSGTVCPPQLWSSGKGAVLLTESILHTWLSPLGRQMYVWNLSWSDPNISLILFHSKEWYFLWGDCQEMSWNMSHKQNNSHYFKCVFVFNL